MLLIATDEAGYGPKLGPLVIAGTAWRIPDVRAEVTTDDLADLFTPLRTRQPCGERFVIVDDSKAVYKPTKDVRGKQAGLESLHAVFSASLHWCRRDESTLSEILPHLSPDDLTSVADAPWLGFTGDECFSSPSITDELLQRWQESGITLADMKARIITAAAFNYACDSGGNKADLLSESTLGLVRTLADLHGSNEPIAVYCDRHGGRRYYASVLQHVFPDTTLHVIRETKQQSVYRLIGEQIQMEIHFTVKGDSFTPVALSSMHAKYLRERMMESFNAYFSARRGAATLKPTAGYPVDADRFLANIAPIIQREQIDERKLVRSR